MSTSSSARARSGCSSRGSTRLRTSRAQVKMTFYFFGFFAPFFLPPARSQLSHKRFSPLVDPSDLFFVFFKKIKKLQSRLRRRPGMEVRAGLRGVPALQGREVYRREGESCEGGRLVRTEEKKETRQKKKTNEIILPSCFVCLAPPPLKKCIAAHARARPPTSTFLPHDCII